MRPTLLTLIAALLMATGCVSTQSRWARKTTSPISGVCAELAKLTRVDSIESRKHVMDSLGFETTTYSDDKSRVSVLSRPDLVVVIPHDATVSEREASSMNSSKMWQSISTHIDALQTAAAQTSRHVDTVFLAEQSKWTEEGKNLRDSLHAEFSFQTVNFEDGLTDIENTSSRPYAISSNQK